MVKINKLDGQKLMYLIHKKKEFLLLVLSNLIVQLGITYYVMNNLGSEKVGLWSLFFAQLIMIVVLCLPLSPAVKFLVFCAFSYTSGLMLSLYKKKYSAATIEIAIQGALSVFGLMMAVGVLLVGSGIQLGYKFAAFLFWALLALIVARLVLVLGQGLSTTHKILSYIGIILFSLFVVYDTNNILSREYYGDFVSASLDYYLDIINLFSNFLGIGDAS